MNLTLFQNKKRKNKPRELGKETEVAVVATGPVCRWTVYLLAGRPVRVSALAGALVAAGCERFK